MSHLSALLAQDGPLDPHEVDDLQAWLACLEDDVATFGATPQDENLMARIRAKIDTQDPSDAKPKGKGSK